jgi:glycosyltransferase involved in cell wall biosynthesis
MPTKVCFVYPWATIGGVERVLLNRLLAFSKLDLDVQADLVFKQDAGGLKPLQKALGKHGLEPSIRVGLDLAKGPRYDFVSCIDCPEAIAVCDQHGLRYIAECHTSYAENRQYLKTLPASCRLIVTPSSLFSDHVRGEVTLAHGAEIVELRNFVPWDLGNDAPALQLPAWTGTPILFLGRMDRLKNPLAFLDALSLLERRSPGRFIGVFCGPQSIQLDIVREIQVRGLATRTVVLPPVPFAATAPLLDMFVRARGLFVSPSRGESFALSAAEALCAGLPVVLSDLPEHCALVAGHENLFTYPLDDSCALADRIEAIVSRYDDALSRIDALREPLSSRVFADDWKALIHRLLGSASH